VGLIQKGVKNHSKDVIMKSIFALSFITVLLTSSLLGCSGGSGNSNNSSGDIYGAWEAVSIVSDSGQKMEIVKPTPGQKTDDDGYLQLKITEKELTLITTDFVTVSDLSLPVKREGNKIVTIATENLSLMDFDIISVSQNEMKLRPAGDGNQGVGHYYIFRRIPEGQLATKLALTKVETQLLSFEVRTSDGSEVLKSTIMMKGDSYKEEGDLISCKYDSDEGRLTANYTKLEINEDGSVSFGGGRDMVMFDVRGINLDDSVKNEIIETTSKEELKISMLQFQNITLSGGKCDYKIEKKEYRKLNVTFVCEGLKLRGSPTETAFVDANFICIDE